jgi:hypothetical protein
MIFNKLERFNNSLTHMQIPFNKYHSRCKDFIVQNNCYCIGEKASAIPPDQSGHSDSTKINIGKSGRDLSVGFGVNVEVIKNNVKKYEKTVSF